MGLQDDLIAEVVNSAAPPPRSAKSRPQQRATPVPGSQEALIQDVVKSAPAPVISPVKTPGDAGKDMSLGRTALDLASTIGSKVDSVTGAPTRAGLAAAAEGKGLRGTIDAFTHQFSAAPETAPTGEEVAKKLGVNDTPVMVPFATNGIPASKVVGTAIDIGADYSNLLPTVAIAKGALRTTEGAGKIGTTAMRIAGAGGYADALEAGWTGAKTYLRGIFNPRIAEDFGTAVKIAEQHGIDPSLLSDSVKYGKDSFLARKGKQLAEGVGGQDRLERHNLGAQQIQDALNSVIVDKVGKGYGPQTVENAGEMIRDAYNKSVASAFDNLEYTYQTVGEKLGIQGLSDDAKQSIQSVMGSIGTEAQWKAKNAATVNAQKQGKFMEKQLARLQESVNGGDYQEIVRQMQEIGKTSYVHHTDIGWDEKSGRELYEALKEGVLSTVETVNPSARQSLEQSNRQLSKLFGDMKLVDGTIRNPGKGGDAVFRELVEGGNSKKLDALRDIIGGDEDAMAVIKATYLDNLKRIGKDGDFSFASMGNAFRNDARVKTVAEKLFTQDELQDLGNVVSLGEKHGSPILSTSGTGASNSFRDTIGNLKAHTVDEGTIAYLKRKAEAAKNQGKTSPVRAVPGLSFSGVEPDELSKLRSAVQSIQNLMPSRTRALNKSLQAYSVQDSPMRRRLNDKK
jgi:hypothetical protein